MKLPEHLKVGGINYRVEVDQETTEAAGAYGLTSLAKCWIKLGASPPNAPGRVRATLVHEALHAIIDCYNGGENAVIDERTVDNLANGIYQVLRDNPEFVAAVLADDEVSLEADPTAGAVNSNGARSAPGP